MSEWKTYRLGDICTFVAGFAFKSKDFGNYPDKVIKIADIQPPIVDMSSLTGIDISQYSSQKLEKYKTEKGDYVLAMTGATIGKLGRIVSEKKAYINQRVLLFKPIDKYIDKNYLYYYLCQNTFFSHIRNHIDSETAQPNISANSIGEFTLTLPSLDEQRRIAGILGSLDDKIELNQRINANLEAQAQALFRSWFVDFEPFRNGPFVDSELGKIPQGWKVETLSNLATVIKKGITPSNSETYSHYSIPAYDDAHFPERQSGETIKSGKYIVYNNSILLSKLNPRIKRLWFIKTAEENAICSTEFIPIQTKDTDLISFVYYLIDNDIFYQQALSLVNGATGSHQRFHAEDIMQIPFAWNKDAAINFAQKANCILQKIEDNIKENQTLSTLRDTLLPKLMAGEIAIE